MSEGADSIARTCDNSPTTLKTEENPEELPPRVITHTGRRPRFGTGNAPLSPYILIDGKKLRSALALRKKWPPRRVSFPTNDSHLVTGYLEPANPWKLGEDYAQACPDFRVSFLVLFVTILYYIIIAVPPKISFHHHFPLDTANHLGFLRGKTDFFVVRIYRKLAQGSVNDTALAGNGS